MAKDTKHSLRTYQKRVSPPPSVSLDGRNPKRRRTDVIANHGDQQGENGEAYRQVQQPDESSSTFTALKTDQPLMKPSPSPKPALIEAGRATISDHISYFTSHYSAVLQSQARKILKPREAHVFPSPLLSLTSFTTLFSNSAGRKNGRHFVIQQHDHPRSGLHYDLRLQISPDSSVSWSIPYGLPGNPNERIRHGRRQAIETRIHPMWNHLVESASYKTGSVLIWDTGIYEILPYKKSAAGVRDQETTDEEDDLETSAGSHTERLCDAFRNGKLRVRLHGTRLPKRYTFAMVLSPRSAKRNLNPGRGGVTFVQKSKKAFPAADPYEKVQTTSGSSSGDDEAEPSAAEDANSDDDYTAERASIRANNAYPGSHNTVGSVHQRWWFVYLDKESCGFERRKDANGKTRWICKKDETDVLAYPFYVRGRDVERSLVTGRLAADVLRDEDVVGYTPRSGWLPILD